MEFQFPLLPHLLPAIASQSYITTELCGSITELGSIIVSSDPRHRDVGETQTRLLSALCPTRLWIIVKSWHHVVGGVISAGESGLFQFAISSVSWTQSNVFFGGLLCVCLSVCLCGYICVTLRLCVCVCACVCLCVHVSLGEVTGGCKQEALPCVQLASIPVSTNSTPFPFVQVKMLIYIFCVQTLQYSKPFPSFPSHSWKRLDLLGTR